MEGYSVTEAASILGVPTERVWELLARGILSGAPDGETGMRVFLQPRAAPAPAPVEVHAQTDAPRGEPERELSPFRELLTEFRNLTERYGQALLALGEARGEVAALRSRVDLLEARMDLRLPGTAAPSPAMPWLGRHAAGEPAPSPGPPAASPEVSDEPHGTAADDVEVDPRGRRRRNSHRRATDVFAEALARAEDPSLRDLPGAAEAADALAALREGARAAETDTETAAAAEPEPTEAALPRELPLAEPVPVADEPESGAPPGESGAGPEAAPEPESEPGAVEATPEPVVASEGTEEEAEPQAEVPEAEPPSDAELAVAASAAEPGPDEASEAGMQPSEEQADTAPAEEEIAEAAALQQSAAAAVEPEPVAVEPTSDAVPPPADAEADSSVSGPTEEPEPVRADAPAEAEPEVPEEPIEWDRERYTTSLGEPDWYAAEDLPFDEPQLTAVASAMEEPSDATRPPEPSAEQAPPVAEEPEPDAAKPEAPWPAEDEPGPLPDRGAQEEHLLWFGREPAPRGDSADASEPDEGGADEMEVAGTGTPRQGGGTTRLPGSWDLNDALAALDAMAGRNRGAGEESVPRPPDGLPREHRSPASRAYRRLRRILPG